MIWISSLFGTVYHILVLSLIAGVSCGLESTSMPVHSRVTCEITPQTARVDLIG